YLWKTDKGIYSEGKFVNWEQEGGDSQHSRNVKVLPKPSPSPTPTPVVDLKINSSDSTVTISAGKTIALTWESSGAPDSCNASGDWSGIKNLNGSETAGPLYGKNKFIYSLICSNNNGSGNDSMEVNVSDLNCNPRKFSNKTWINLGVSCNQEKPGYKGERWLCQKDGAATISYKKYKKDAKLCGSVIRTIPQSEIDSSNY
ncbi:hypothetical protein HYW44_02690, partial [Candidatus Daviesbacteria bacterium]|nr:hypothetical protein [Candidatus Daviesbacteria bacterium]